MISLIYLLTIPLIFTGLVLIMSVNKTKRNRYEGIAKTRDVSTIEENYFTIPYVLVKYYSHIIDIRRNLAPSLMSKSYWYENIELYNIKKLDNDKKEFNKINAKIGLVSALIVYFLLMIIWSRFERSILNYQNISMIGKMNPDIIHSLDMLLGLDALSLPFILLTGFIMPIVYLSNWTTIDKYNDYYVVIILGLEIFLLGVFLVIDFIMFYIFFESTLPLLFLLIGLYGAAQKFRAGYYLFLYTLLGSLFMLLSFVKLGGDTASTFFECYSDENTFQLLQQIVWTVLFVSFSVKTPLVPVHIWLPLAHSDANVSGSIILASIVLKLALYGFIRILIGIFYLATTRLTSFFLGYCSMSLLFSSFTTIRQFDLKVLVAYSSIAHMASSLLGTFSDTLYGLIGSIIFGLAHGFVSPGLFIIVGAVLYDRCGTRIMNYFKGLSNILPFLALIFLILVFGNMGVPLTGNFIGEFLSLLGAYQQNIFIATIGTISVITSAIYSINTYNKTTSGSMSPYILTIPDLFRKEYYTLLPLIVLTLILGIYPSFISSDIEFGLSSNLMLVPIMFIKDNTARFIKDNTVKPNLDQDNPINLDNPLIPEEDEDRNDLANHPAWDNWSTTGTVNEGSVRSDNDNESDSSPDDLNSDQVLNGVNDNQNGNSNEDGAENENDNSKEDGTGNGNDNSNDNNNNDNDLNEGPQVGTRAPNNTPINTPSNSPVVPNAEPPKFNPDSTSTPGCKPAKGFRPDKDSDGSCGGITCNINSNGISGDWLTTFENIYFLYDHSIPWWSIRFSLLFLYYIKKLWNERLMLEVIIKDKYNKIITSINKYKKKIKLIIFTYKNIKKGIFLPFLFYFLFIDLLLNIKTLIRCGYILFIIIVNLYVFKWLIKKCKNNINTLRLKILGNSFRK